MRILRLAALFLLGGTVGSPSISAQTVSGLPQPSLPTMQRAATGAQLDPNQAFDRRPAGEAPRVSASPLSPSEIRITWNPVPGAVGYLVSRNPATTPQILTPAAITATELVDKDLLPNTTASYKVWADFGPQSPNSPGGSAVVTAATPPAVNPSGFTASSYATEVTVKGIPIYTTSLRWNPAPGAAYYSVKSGGQLVYEGPDPAAGVRNVSEGEHYYDLVAYYGPTGAAVGDTGTPAHVWGNAFPIKYLEASVIPSPRMAVKLSWGVVPLASSYAITRWTVNPQTGALENQVPLAYNVAKTEYYDTGYFPPNAPPQYLVNGATYRYYVEAVFPYHYGPGRMIRSAVRVTLPP